MGSRLTITLISHLLHGTAQVLGDVIYEVLLLILLLAKDVPELPRLHEIVVRNVALEIHDCPNPLLMGDALLVLCRCNDLRLEVAGDVVGCGAVVGEVTYAVTTSRVVGVERPVDRDIVEVYSESVPLRLAIGKKTDLENWVVSLYMIECE
jgi:hypothetical protein